MKEKKIEDLMGVRESIRVVDATLRDGGLVNSFRFTDAFVRALYQANLRAGVDYMELGYKASREIFDEKEFGVWKFCDDEDILRVIGENRDTGLKLAVMADVGRCDKKDIRPASESPVELVRIATYVHQMPGALDMVEDAKAKGYEVSCNIMAISTAQEADIKAALEMLGKSSVDVIYIVDSFGSIYPEQMARITDTYLEFAERYGKKLGIHAHNNQQLAFANTLEACGDGVDYLDGTYNGMGRGAGNCSIENLIGCLKNPKYKLLPVLEFIEQQMVPLRESGVVWGYDMQYLLTGLMNQHPRSAIAYTKDGRTDIAQFYNELMQQE